MEKDIAFGEPGGDMPDQKRVSASTFTQGMYDFPSDCQMRNEPNSAGASAGTVRAGKRLWVEPLDANWHKVYKKNGAVFISADCLK